MYYLAATIHTLGFAIGDTAHRKIAGDPHRRDQGSVTMEQVLWAVAMIAIVGIVVVAIKNYVTSKAAEIK